MIAIAFMEASPLTNAGLGSCLTEAGKVECDASMMLGNGSFGGVGGVSGVEHAIQVAYQLAKERNELGLVKELGRVRPIMLVGDGAYIYAQEHGFAVAPRESIDQHHVTWENKAKWTRYKHLIDADRIKRGAENGDRAGEERTKQHLDRNATDVKAAVDAMSTHQGQSTSFSHTDEAVEERKTKRRLDHDVADTKHAEAAMPITRGDPTSISQGPAPLSITQLSTVGAIACDYTGQVCAGVSSGGIWMKQGGRIGSAALIGCGCHAENGVSQGRDGTEDLGDVISVACSISGCGEDITEELMALRCCDELKKDIPQETRQEGALTHLESIMRQSMVKKELVVTSSVQSKKRRKNASGSTDTQINDDGLSTGVIALRVATPAKTARKRNDGLGEPLKLEFCYAHTAPHFALAYACRNSQGQENVCTAWISAQNDEQRVTKAMKAGEVQFVIQPSDQRWDGNS